MQGTQTFSASAKEKVAVGQMGVEMNLPDDSEIPLPKLLQYVLVPLARAGKSKFIARAGYIAEDAPRLIQDLRYQILPLDATPAGATKFGDFFEIPFDRRSRLLIFFWEHFACLILTL